MTLSRATLKAGLIEFIDQHPNVRGQNGMQALHDEFVEPNKLCPETFQELIHELMREEHQFKGGRKLVPAPKFDVWATQEFRDRLWAQKTYHAGGIVCPKSQSPKG